jgi:hypothetical protein
LVEVKFVRNVAPKKDMMRVSFRVPRHVLLLSSETGSRRGRSSSREEEENMTTSKKLCTEEA